jgi:N-acetyl-anhydromuramyl-L-alanine amidase AmpD
MLTIYPGAKLHLLKNHSAPGDIKNRKMVVLHITQGSTAAGAIATFESSVSPHRVSAHFVIDRDGTITQLVDLMDTAWHASQVNSKSVGIEHVAHVAQAPFKDVALATEAQYQASAKLVAWLCEELLIPISRGYVRTHNEVSPGDHHPQCCTGALDPDRVVKDAQALSQIASPPPSSPHSTSSDQSSPTHPDNP